jgi:hypothetical protein
MYDKAPNSVERLESIYRYLFEFDSDRWVNNMTGKCKNSDWERRVSIRETREDSLKIW